MTVHDRPAPEPPDRWLQEALRHAPDHDTAVPAPVRESILRTARGTATAGAAAVAPGFWQELRQRWLRPQPLGYSGAFITVAVLGIWGLGGLEQQARQGPGDVASTAAMAPPPTSSEAAATVVAEAANAATAAPAAPAVRPEPATAAKTPARTGPAAPLADAAPRSVAAPPVDRARPPSPPAVAHADATVPEQRMPGAAMSAPAPLAEPAPAVKLASESPAVPAAAPPAAVATAAPAARVDLASREVVNPAPLLDPLGPLLRDLQPRSARSAAAAGLAGDAGDGRPAWLGRLRSATAGRWSESADAPPDAPPLTVPGDTSRSTAIWLAKPGTVWARVDGRLYRAAIDPAVMDTLAAPR